MSSELCTQNATTGATCDLFPTHQTAHNATIQGDH